VAGTRHTSGIPAAAWPLVVLFGAAIAGVLGGAVVAFLSYSGSGDGDDWAELGAIIIGLLGGLVVFGVAYVVGMVLAARRAFRPGARAFPLALALGIPVGFVVLVLGVSGVADLLQADVTPFVGVLAAGAVLAAAPLAFGFAGTTAGRRRLLVAVAAAAALVVAVAGVGIGVERARTSRIVAQLPLVLFDGRTADAPFAGWRLDDFSSMWIIENRRSFTEQGHSAFLKYRAPGGVVFVTMHTEVGACVDTVSYACRVDGAVNGGEQRTYTRVARYGSYPRSPQFTVLANADGSAVSVSSEGALGAASALGQGRAFRVSPDVVLRSLVRVDRDTFETATGSTLRFR
jgi:hypothetical protein